MTVVKREKSRAAITARNIKSRGPRIQNIRADRNRKGVREKVRVDIIGGDKMLAVAVCIESAKGKYIEDGMAVQQRQKNCWLYETVNRNQIIAGAKIEAVGLTNKGKLIAFDVMI